MKHKSTRFLPLLLIPLLASCAGATSRPWDADWNPQQYAGITAVDAEWKENENALERVKVFSGKEGETFDIVADLKTGTVTWKATAVRAFPAFKSRADVEKFVAEHASNAVKNVAPAVIDLIMKAAGL